MTALISTGIAPQVLLPQALFRTPPNSPSRCLQLNDLIYPLSQELPRSTPSVHILSRVGHRRISLDLNSEPLSDLRYAGIPRSTNTSVLFCLAPFNRTHQSAYIAEHL